MKRKNTTTRMLKQSIIDSFLLLLKDSDYEQITISEITGTAGVNRSTYYRHFTSKDNIICAYYENLLVEHMQTTPLPDLAEMEGYLCKLFLIMAEHKDELLLIYRSGRSHLLLHVFNQYFIDKSNRTDDLRTYYHAGGIFNCNLFWFEHDMDTEPRELAALAVSAFPQDFISLVRHS